VVHANKLKKIGSSLRNAQKDVMTKGMETLVGVRGGIVQGFDDKPAN